MKKTVILILLLLPIFLMITISYMGRIISSLVHIYVENIVFVDENGDELDKDFEMVIDKNETYQINVNIKPELATYKDVTFTSSSPNTCSVDENGLITGLEYGSAIVVVKSKDTQKTASFYIKVYTNRVSQIILPENYPCSLGFEYKLRAEILPTTADKRAVWTSSNTSVATVVEVGTSTTLKTVGVGTSVITCRVGDKISNECLVTVTDDGVFASAYSKTNQYHLNGDTISMLSLIQLRTGVDASDVQFSYEIVRGSDYASINSAGTLFIFEDVTDYSFWVVITATDNGNTVSKTIGVHKI